MCEEGIGKEREREREKEKDRERERQRRRKRDVFIYLCTKNSMIRVMFSYLFEAYTNHIKYEFLS